MEKSNSRVDDDQHYFRGLEGRTKEGYKRKRFDIADACMTVMEEQSDQSDFGTSCPEVISRAYMATTTSCTEDARVRGLFDEKALFSKDGALSLTNYI